VCSSDLVKRLCTKCENSHDVQKLKNGYVIRIKIPNSENITLTDLVQGGITVENQEIDNFIILRNDGTPTYMLAVVVDDFDMGVNLIIRGDDHLNNSFRQFYIYKNMHWPIPQYAHIPLIHGEDGKKLSKRHGVLNISEFKEKGYLQEAIINNLILLGWAPSNDDEIISLEEIINNFEIKNLSKSSSIFNYDKLNYFNCYYLRKDTNVKNFHDYSQTNPQLKTFYRKDKEKLKRIFNIYKTKINYYKELENISPIYFEENFVTKKNILLNKEFKELLKKCIILLENLDLWENIKIEDLIKNFINTNKIKFISFGKPLRFTLINLENGPAVSDIFFILGKKNSILRLNNYIKG
jgi:glutamyl-tRNA synthetase